MKPIDTTKPRRIIVALSIIFYIMEGVLLNPAIIWVVSPLIFIYIKLKEYGNKGLIHKVNAANGFLIGSSLILFLGHLAWVYDTEGKSTGSLIFAVIPIYSFIVGGIGYYFGRLESLRNNA